MSPVRPSRSASNRGSTTPAAATVPGPPTSTDNVSDHASAGSSKPWRLLVAFTRRCLFPRSRYRSQPSVFSQVRGTFPGPDTPETRDHMVGVGERVPAGGGSRRTGTLGPCPTAVTTTVGRSRATKPVAYQPVRLSEVSRGGPPSPAGSITTIAATTRGCVTRRHYGHGRNLSEGFVTRTCHETTPP